MAIGRVPHDVLENILKHTLYVRKPHRLSELSKTFSRYKRRSHIKLVS